MKWRVDRLRWLQNLFDGPTQRRVLVHQVDQWQYQPAARHEWDVVCAYKGVEGVIHVIMRGQ